MTILDAYALIVTACPQAGKNANGRKGFGRAILRNWKRASSEPERQAVLVQMDEPTKSVILRGLSEV